MNKELILAGIRDSGLIAVVRTDNKDEAISIVEAFREGGAIAIEITFTVPGALDLLTGLARRFDGSEVLIGAGTVMDASTARLALLAGAKYIVSPHFDPLIIEICHRYRAPVIPGTMSVTEIVRALDCGADMIKVFPGDVLGPVFFRAVRGPLPKAPLVPSGGVNLGNIHEWINAGAVALSVGRPLMEGIQPGDHAALASRTRDFLATIRKARAEISKRP